MFNGTKLTGFQAGLVVAALFSLYLGWQTVSPQFLSGERTVDIERGENFLEIASNLRSAGVIKSRAAFIVAAIYRGSVSALRAGQYVFEPGLNLYGIMGKVERGEVVPGSDEVTVVFPEGIALAEASGRLAEAGFGDIKLGLIKASAFAERFPWLTEAAGGRGTIEGFLFPDTYRFSKEAAEKEILEKILNRFETKTMEVRTADALVRKSFYDILIMASILEKEVPPVDMPRAAGVLWKRLELGMPLQADATLVYALGRPIKRSDTTAFDSPYNTYKFKGLPPSPISNPGLAALRAASRPEASSYLYYLSRPRDGATVFSETLGEHNIAKAMYLGN